jgi:hypothetical protein
VGSWTKIAGVWKQSFVPFNDASGGTISTFTNGGFTYRRHLFTTAGAASLVITANPNPFRVTMIGGGGESGYADNLAGDGTPGGSGGGYLGAAVTLPTGTLSMQVGVQCAGANINTAANDTTITGVGTCGGGGHGKRTYNNTGRTDGRAGTLGANSTGGNGGNGDAYDTPQDPSVSFRTLLDGTIGTWGKYGAGVPASGGGTNPGQNGMICIEYVIA